MYTITRGLGFHGDKSIKQFILPTPTFKSYKVEPGDVCVIIATKGLWKALSYDKVAQLVLQVLCQDFSEPNRSFKLYFSRIF
jgi:serine/threonine protein phosphatase PrpC